MIAGLVECCDTDPHYFAVTGYAGFMSLSAVHQWFEKQHPPTYVCIERDVYQYLGVHRNRQVQDFVCLRHLETDVQYDLLADHFHVEMTHNEEWIALASEMEVIAWASR